MAHSCIIYARVSTKEQSEEGYSIPAQLKAVRAFCESEGLSPVAEFVETESAGHTGRTRFTEMLSYLESHPEVHTVVAHKLDRLYRNFADQVSLEERLGVRARYVLGDVPDTPQGELLRDVQLSVAKYYLGNLREEVKKGMEEKVAQGGWPHRAPLGYVNDRVARNVTPDPATASLVRWAFERYSAGAVALPDLATELQRRGLTRADGSKLPTSTLHKALSNPFYCGRILYKGQLYPGAHEPLVSVPLFESVQAKLAGNRNGTKRRKRVYSLRGVMRCAECGCLITAGTHKEHVYYRCTHGKGECSQSAYIREEKLMEQVETLLGSIAIGPEVLAALAEDAGTLIEERRVEIREERAALERKLAGLRSKENKLLDGYLDGAVPVEMYRERADELSVARRALELRLSEFDSDAVGSIEQVRELALVAGSARVNFKAAPGANKRAVLETVLCNLDLRDGDIASYQWKGPFGLLEKEPSGAFKNEWWAILDLNQ